MIAKKLTYQTKVGEDLFFSLFFPDYNRCYFDAPLKKREQLTIGKEFLLQAEHQAKDMKR